MTEYGIARKASKSPKLSLHKFPQFAGTGVVPINEKSDDLAVAVYVTCPKSKLPQSFRQAVPAFVDVRSHGSLVSVPTRIVNLGEIEISI